MHIEAGEALFFFSIVVMRIEGIMERENYMYIDFSRRPSHSVCIKKNVKYIFCLVCLTPNRAYFLAFLSTLMVLVILSNYFMYYVVFYVQSDWLSTIGSCQLAFFTIMISVIFFMSVRLP